MPLIVDIIHSNIQELFQFHLSRRKKPPKKGDIHDDDDSGDHDENDHERR